MKNYFLIFAFFTGGILQSQSLPTPTITAMGSTLSCNGIGIWLASSAKTDNLWSTGSQNTIIYVVNSGTYSVLQSNGSQTSLPSAAITVSVLPPATFMPVGQVCASSAPVTLSCAPIAHITGVLFYINFSGPGVSGVIFDPPKANIGSNNIVTLHVDYNVGNTLCSDTMSQRITVLDCTGLSEQSDNPEFIVYPNPSQDDFILDDTRLYLSEIEISNATGKKTPFTLIPGENKTCINITGIPGVYFLRLTRGEKSQVVKLIKL
jgi:hypothetical protein